MIRLGTPRHRYPSVKSTMDLLSALAADGAPEGTIVVADEQTAGRGRAGRSWQAAPGSALLCSVLLRPNLSPRRLGSLSLIAGLVVAEAIEAIVPIETRLKWPNDVYIGERKICGVLVQVRAVQAHTEFVNLGIGLNVSAPERDLPSGATSLNVATGQTVTLETVEHAVMQRLSDRYAEFLASSGEPPLDAWRSRAMFLGEPVEIEQDGAILSGTFTGVTESGALLLETGSGVRRVVSGDLTRGPRRAG